MPVDSAPTENKRASSSKLLAKVFGHHERSKIVRTYRICLSCYQIFDVGNGFPVSNEIQSHSNLWVSFRIGVLHRTASFFFENAVQQTPLLQLLLLLRHGQGLLDGMGAN